MAPRPLISTRMDTLFPHTPFFRPTCWAGTKPDSWQSEDGPRLGAVLAECGHLLRDGAADPQHDFHLAAVATAHAGFGCTLRTVVLRGVDPAARELRFYTDLRSRKIGEMASDHPIALAFHALSEETQLLVPDQATLPPPRPHPHTRQHPP